MLINIHSVIPVSKTNGPGRRMVIFFQGCLRKCPGCFNPETHSQDITNLLSPERIFKENCSGRIEGITVSGGEPFLQAKGLYRLLDTAKKDYGFSTVVYTGYTYRELETNRSAASCLSLIDVLIDGAYDETVREKTLLARGSTNQELHILSNRYRMEDFYMQAKAEVIIGKDGLVRGTGFSSKAISELKGSGAYRNPAA